MSKIINVILSGGSGTRLWPLSRKGRPKQFLRMFEGMSLFQHTLLRNQQLVDGYHVVTNGAQQRFASDQSGTLDIQLDRLTIEPFGRNTAAAIALAALAQDDSDILLVTPSDHMITADEQYINAVREAVTKAKEGYLMTFGIQPDYPETGFGYIEAKDDLVIQFREKPDLKTAEHFLADGNFLWNSGMFCFKAGVFLNELKLYSPKIYDTVLQSFLGKKDDVIPEHEFDIVPSLSVDYAVMEKSKLIKVVHSSFAWTDLGSYRSLVEYHKKVSAVDGVMPMEGVSNENSFYSSVSGKPVFAFGIKDSVVIEQEDCILLLPLGGDGIKDVYKQVQRDHELIL